jgi:hypothetical protein
MLPSCIRTHPFVSAPLLHKFTGKYRKFHYYEAHPHAASVMHVMLQLAVLARWAYY